MTVFGFQVSRPHLETGERCTNNLNVILIQYSDGTETDTNFNPVGPEGLWSTPACFIQADKSRRYLKATSTVLIRHAKRHIYKFLGF